MLKHLLLGFLLVSVAAAQEPPVEIKLKPPPAQVVGVRPPPNLLPCPGCDCRGNGCFMPKCGCGGRVDDNVAQQLLEYSQLILHRTYEGKLDLEHPVKVKAVSPQTLAELGGGEVYGLYDDEKNLIYVSNAVTKADALGIVAHELGHAWMYQHHPNADGTSELFCEGFAEWVAYQVLTRAGNFGQASIIRRSGDPTYGDGFRWFQKIERDYGLDALLDVATRWLDIDFPKQKS